MHVFVFTYHTHTLSVEELYQGAIKKMKITKSVTDTSGRQEFVAKILEITIRPGWREGRVFFCQQ